MNKTITISADLLERVKEIPGAGQGGRTNRERKTRARQDTRATERQGTLKSHRPPAHHTRGKVYEDE